MALPQGIDFRASSGYATDPTNCTYEIGIVDNYPWTTPQGNNVGYESAPGGNTRDRNSGFDARIAGVHFTTSPGVATYRIDLPSAGSYSIRLAAGDNGGNTAYVELFDSTASLGVLCNKGWDANFADATGTSYSAANWPASNAAVSKIFASTICRLKNGTNNGGNNAIAHVYIESVGGGSTDSLTASSIIASPATVGSPPLSQQHVLSASSIAAAPAVVASPAITQQHALSATAVSASPAVVGLPSITQKHALSATVVSASTAIVGSPALVEIIAGVLSALPIVAAPAAVGAPALGQKHALSAGAIAAGPATFGAPTLAQQHALMAQGITAGAAIVGSPALTPGGAALFTPEQLAYILAYVEANMAVPTPAEISAAVLAALQAATIPVNVKQVNSIPIKGAGVSGNTWGPA